MAELTTNQYFHLLLGDLTMAAGISVHDPAHGLADSLVNYAPGRVRDAWLAQVTDPQLRQRVVSLANAAMGSLQRMPQDELSATATRYGIPIDAELAEAVAAHFEQRRNAVLRYRR